MQHFVITKFNLRLSNVSADKRGQQVLTRDWLAERLGLFERYCLPSVLHQRERRFTWLLLLDEATDPEVVARVEAYRAYADNLEPVYLPPVAGPAEVAQPVLARLDAGTELLVTTGLDNDDALHEDALAEVRRRVRNRREFLNLRIGFVTDGVRATVMYDKYGSFTTFVEPVGGEPLRTVYCIPHPKQWRLATVRQIAERPLWLRVIHPRNVLNKAFGERHDYGFRTAKQLESTFRHLLIKPIRYWLRPRAHRREYRLEEIADPFHIGDLPGRGNGLPGE